MLCAGREIDAIAPLIAQGNINIWIEAWSNLGHFEIIPARTSAEAAQHIASKL